MAAALEARGEERVPVAAWRVWATALVGTLPAEPVDSFRRRAGSAEEKGGEAVALAWEQGLALARALGEESVARR